MRALPSFAVRSLNYAKAQRATRLVVVAEICAIKRVTTAVGIRSGGRSWWCVCTLLLLVRSPRSLAGLELSCPESRRWRPNLKVSSRSLLPLYTHPATSCTCPSSQQHTSPRDLKVSTFLSLTTAARRLCRAPSCFLVVTLLPSPRVFHRGGSSQVTRPAGQQLTAAVFASN